MRAIIPVAGVGIRLRPHTFSRPKVLLNVAGKPILAHILDKVIAEGITSATIVIGYLGEMIEEYVRTHYPGLDVSFVTQSERKGLGHSIWMARETYSDEPILIILGDTIFEVDLHQVLKLQHSALGVKSVDDPRRFGVVELNDGKISRLVEKPEHPVSNLAIVGIYYIRNTPLLKECLNELIEKDIRTRGEYQLTDALQMMLGRGETMVPFPVEGWFDCGKSETLLSTNKFLLERKSTNSIVPDSIIIPPVYIAETAEITHSIIGPHATVADGAVIRQSIVRNSIIDDNAHVINTLLDNSIVGANAVVKGSFKRINAGDSSEIDFY